MRTSLFLLLLTGCSSALPAPPVRVVGDGVEGLIRACEVASVAQALDEVFLAASEREWRQLRAAVGAPLPALAEFSVERVVALPLPGDVALGHVEVSSEEGVDVVTADVAPAAAPASAPRLVLLRVLRRPCQLAVVLRDDVRGAERTLAVYPASR